MKNRALAAFLRFWVAFWGIRFLMKFRLPKNDKKIENESQSPRKGRASRNLEAARRNVRGQWGTIGGSRT